MKERCFNHPDKEATSFCHACGHPFCADCLVEGKEFYYCRSTDCERAAHREMLPLKITCPRCNIELKLSYPERVERRFFCSSCDAIFDMTQDDGSMTQYSTSLSVSAGEKDPWYHPLSIKKLVMMSILTWGLYEAYWFYMNWKRVRDRTGERLSPVARAFFCGITSFSLFRRIRADIEYRKMRVSFSPDKLAAAYILTLIAVKLPGTFWLISFLSVAVLATVQRNVNQLNANVCPGTEPDNHFSVLNILGMVVGGLLLALTILTDILVP